MFFNSLTVKLLDHPSPRERPSSLECRPLDPAQVHVPRIPDHDTYTSDTNADENARLLTEESQQLFFGRPLGNQELMPQHGDPESALSPAGAGMAILDRRNEFFCLKRFIFLSFGVPGAPVLTPKYQQCISMCASLVHSS